jgi:hypothetical protein
MYTKGGCASHPWYANWHLARLLKGLLKNAHNANIQRVAMSRDSTAVSIPTCCLLLSPTNLSPQNLHLQALLYVDRSTLRARSASSSRTYLPEHQPSEAEPPTTRPNVTLDQVSSWTDGPLLRGGFDFSRRKEYWTRQVVT